MNIHYDLEQLRRRIGLIETNLDEARKQLAALDAQIRAEEAAVEPEPIVAQTGTDAPFEPVPWMPPQSAPPAVPAMPPPLPRYEIPAPATAERAGGQRGGTVAATPEWKAWLQRLQLWPPEDGQNSEVRLGAWWATRLGTLLAVIGVVFFGVYVSLDTPPWVKFVELCSICGGVAVLGLWLEKRIARFGTVVFAGGLALVYFCAFAGYALPAVKVLANPAAAVGWQLAAVLLIAGASVSRRSASIATMAVGLGYVTAIFSRAGGLHDFALVTAALLAIAAVGFHRWLRWEAPSVVALPGSYAVYALVLQGNWLGGGVPSPWWPWVFLGGIVTLFFARDWRSVRVAHDQVGAGECWFQGANSSLAALLGVVTALTLYRGELAEFYFGAAALLGCFSVMRRHQIEGDAIGAVLLAKTTGAFTLGVIEVADGRTTALALLVQAWVMLFSARRLGSRVLAVGTGVVALLATLYFFHDGTSAMPLVSWQAAGALAFIVGIAWLAAEGRRAISKEDFTGAMYLEVIGALVAAAGAVMSVFHLQPGGWTPALLIGVAAVLGLPAIVRRALAPLAAASMLMMVANVSLWQLVESSTERDRLVANAVAVLFPCAVVGAFLGSKRMPVIGALVCAVTMLGFAHLLFALTVPVIALAVMSLLAMVLGALAPLWGRRHLLWLATWAGMLGVLFWREAGASVDSAGWLLVAAMGAWALPIGLHGSQRHLAALKSENQSGGLVMAQMAVALLVTVDALPFYFDGAAHVLACAVTALAVFGLTRWPGIRIGLEASWVLWVAALGAILKMTLNRYSDFDYSIPQLVIAGLLAWVPAVVLSHVSGIATEQGGGRWWRRCAPGVQTLIATLLSLLVCVRCFRGEDLLMALVSAVAVAVLVLRLGRVPAARESSVALAVCALWAAWAFVGSGRAEGGGKGLACVLLVAVALIALPLVIATAELATGKINRLRWGFGIAGLGLAFFAALAQQGALDPYATVGWGLASIVVFMTGLFARTRPYRMLGLLGLALCVPRVFLVDLDSALHRIAAFVVLGLVLLWVGFSYHRFRHFIADEPGEDKSP